MKKAWLPLPAALVLFALQFGFVAAYLAQEQAIQFWDYAMYANMAKEWFLQGNPDQLLASFLQSFAYKYNFLYAVPSYFSFSAFGATRDVFIKTNFTVFFIAQQIAFACVLYRLYPLSKTKSLLWAAALSILVPFFWYPLLQGYPDNGAGAFLTFALAVALGNRKSWWSALSIGVLLGLSIVFRRHFAYPALALLASIGGVELWALYKEKTRAKAYLRPVCFGGLAGLAVLGVLLAAEPAYLKEMVTTNFQALYHSYQRDALYFTLFLLGRVGLFLSAAVAAGFFFSLKAQTKTKQNLVFVCVFTLVWFVLWIAGPSQAGDHYLIAVPPVFCIVGLAGFFLFLMNAPDKRKKIVFILSLLALMANSAYALWLAPRFPMPNEAPIPSFFSVARPPWVRKDMDSLLDLAKYLTHTTRPKDRIAIVSSSFILNQDLMHSIYTDITRRTSTARRFVFIPEIDHVQPAPLDAYTGATVYVVPEPTQYHLPPSGQKVLTAFAKQFPPPPQLATYFQPDPKIFTLADNVKVRVWRRVPWTPGALHFGLKAIRENVESPIRWVAEKRPVAFATTHTKAYGAVAQFRFAAGAQAATLFYDQPLSAGAYRFGAEVNSQYICQTPEITVKTKDYSGAVVYSFAGKPEKNPGVFYAPALAKGGNGGPYYLSVEISAQPMGECSVVMGNLRVEEIDMKGLPIAPRTE